MGAEHNFDEIYQALAVAGRDVFQGLEEDEKVKATTIQWAKSYLDDRCALLDPSHKRTQMGEGPAFDQMRKATRAAMQEKGISPDASEILTRFMGQYLMPAMEPYAEADVAAHSASKTPDAELIIEGLQRVGTTIPVSQNMDKSAGKRE